MMHPFKSKTFLPLFIIMIVVVSCTVYLNPAFKKTYNSVNELLYADSATHPVLKAHCRNGEVYVFNKQWILSNDHSQLLGEGLLFNAKRALIFEGSLNLAVDSVALFETNAAVASRDGGIVTALSILTAVNFIGIVYCLINPKACYGSCPTFYLPGDDGIMSARAEGFSESILPSWEEADLDNLHNDEVHTRHISLYMKNEALETHEVNYVHLLAVKRNEGEKIFNDACDNFYACSTVNSPQYASAGGLDVTDKVRAFDGNEYFSKTDSFDLGKKEEIILHFKNDDLNSERGLVISFRQSLVTTFLFYSALGYMGNEAGDILADIELHPEKRAAVDAMQERLGNIEAFAWDDLKQQWMPIGQLFEAGPIARNTFILPLTEMYSASSELKIKLVMAKGYWRIDCMELASIINKRSSTLLLPKSVLINGQPNSKDLQALTDDDKQRACSMPGNLFELKFELPDSADYALFVESKGYYLEWMRPTWWKEKNLMKLMRMLDGDEKTWRDLAIEYKEHEADMEATFWGSKIM